MVCNVQGGLVHFSLLLSDMGLSGVLMIQVQVLGFAKTKTPNPISIHIDFSLSF
jgi:hypothetical protein